jgi:hypothetical protein
MRLPERITGKNRICQYLSTLERLGSSSKRNCRRLDLFRIVKRCRSSTQLPAKRGY